MSRIGRKPIIISPEVSLSVDGDTVSVSGTKGQMTVKFPKEIIIEKEANNINIKTIKTNNTSLQGLYRSQIQNALTGVTVGWQKTMELVGVGYRAETTGTELVLNLGFSHPVKVAAPKGINFSVKDNKITVNGIDKYLVGEIAAQIRRLKPPEPYKGKGIRYQGEVIRKKLGKAAKAVGGAGGAK